MAFIFSYFSAYNNVDTGLRTEYTLTNIEANDLESPQAPLCSPLTPYLNTKPICSISEYKFDDMSSPLRPMSPSTLELFHTLSGVHTPPEINNNAEKNINSDSDSDTDPVFIPDSYENSSNEEEVLATSRQQKVVALVNTAQEERSVHNNVSSVENILDNNISDIDNVKSPVEISVVNVTETKCDSINNLEQEVEHLRGRPKKGRKRKFQDHTLAQAKDRKYLNLPYHSNKKNTRLPSKTFQDYTCNCQKKCSELISREKRQEEFYKYVSLGSYEAQLLFITSSVKEKNKARTYTVNESKTGQRRPKNYSRTYTICGTEVCKALYLNNFQITSKKIDVSLKKYRSGNTIKDKRGLAQGGWNKTPQEEIDFIKNIIESLPKYESHYRREQNATAILYLKSDMTIQKIYDLYLDKFKTVYGESKIPVSFVTLKRIFYKHFNLRCKPLKKDTCTRCDTFNIKLKNTESNSEKEKIKFDKDTHLKKAEEMRKHMKKDLLKAKTDKEFECLTFDLEKTLPLPRIPTSIVFYKRQLWLYNCGIHAGSNDTGYCYVWIEGEAGRGAQEVGSCLINFIRNKLDPNVKDLVLWSDCCGGQNRNIKIVVMLKAILHSHHTLRTISFKYLESGHTFLPNDTDFSKIETQLKFHERIYTANEYMQVIRCCKKKNPLHVTKMTKEDFLSSKNIEKNIVNRKIYINKEKTNWLQTKVIFIKDDQKYIIYMKKDINDNIYQELSIEKKIKGKSLDITEKDFVVLWPNGKKIAQPKLDDLKSMFHLIPKDCLNFYQALQGDGNITDDLDGFGGLPDFPIENEFDYGNQD